MKFNHISNFSGLCITEANKDYSYDELYAQILKYELVLKTRINVGDVVVIEADYNFNSISALMALADLSCMIVPIVKISEIEFNNKVKASNANLLIRINKETDLEFSILVPEKEIEIQYQKIVEKKHTGLVLFSSGTTGIPKVISQDFTLLLESFVPPRKQKTIKFILMLMFDHIGGLNTMLNCINNGSPFVIPQDRNPNTIVDLIYRNHVQLLPTTPTFLNLVLISTEDVAEKLFSLKMITYGTERMPESLLSRLNKELPSVRLLQTFGTSETGILKTESKNSKSLFFKIVDNNYSYKIENGELLLKRLAGNAEYLGHSKEKFTEDGFFKTGDLVDQDSDGFIKIIGRKTEVINVGGQKVLPSEVEAVINSIEGVIDSTVFALDNVITGQIVAARIIIADLNETDYFKKYIKSNCREKLDKYKIPAKLFFSDLLITTSRQKKA